MAKRETFPKFSPFHNFRNHIRGIHMRVAIYTLGCKVNQYETQALERELERRGHALVPFDGPADA